MNKEKKIFQIDKKEICITSLQIKHAIDLLVNENEILREEIERLNNIINELEKWLLLEISIHCEDDIIDTLYNGILDKLKELKENK